MPPSRKRLTLLAPITGSSLAFLDSTVVNLALPAIRRDLAVGFASQRWIHDRGVGTCAAVIPTRAGPEVGSCIRMPRRMPRQDVEAGGEEPA